MPAPLVHFGAQIQCPHLGRVSVAPASVRVRVSGAAVARAADVYSVAGCSPPSPLTPCTTVQWPKPALRVQVMGSPVILKTSGGVCLNAALGPQGPPVVLQTQPRVKGT